MICTILAVSAPLAHYAGVGYMAVLLAAGAMLPLTVLAGDGLKRITKPEALLELVWTGVVLGTLIKVSGVNWPGSRSNIVVPLVILGLALASGNRERSIRSCATLFWVILIPGILVLGNLIGQVEPKWLTPEPGNWTAGLIVTLLYPALNGTVNGTGVKTALITTVFAAGTALLIQGGLGIGPAGTMDSPMYELGRCIGDGGFEIIISVLLTLGWYGFASMGMRAAEYFGERNGLTEAKSRTGVFAIAALIVISGIEIGEWVLVSGCLILWILIPLLHPKNKSKKHEKRC